MDISLENLSVDIWDQYKILKKMFNYLFPNPTIGSFNKQRRF